MILKTGKHFQDDTRAEFIYYGKLLSMEQMTSPQVLLFFSNFFKHSGKRRSIHKTPICSQCECEPDLSFAPLCQLAQSSGNCSAKLHKDKRCPY